MNIDLIVIGKTDSSQIETLLNDYLKRLNFYTKVSLVVLPDLKNRKTLSPETQKKQEGEALLRRFSEGDWVVLLDEKGKQMRSVEFSDWVQKRMNRGAVRIFRRGVCPLQCKVVVILDDLFPSDGTTGFSGAALPGFYDFE